MPVCTKLALHKRELWYFYKALISSLGTKNVLIEQFSIEYRK